MSFTIGRIEPFDDSLEDWPTYVERVEQYFAANDVDVDINGLRRSLVLSAVVRMVYCVVSQRQLNHLRNRTMKSSIR